MLYNLYHFVHNSLGICFWELPTFIVAAVMVIVTIVHSLRQKKRKDDFEQARKEKLDRLRKELTEAAGNM